jgi:putative restriction endonuclease
MLEKYLQMFGKLRTEEGRDRYPQITYHRAPHKPFLLLFVMDLIAQGRITKNLIEPAYRILGDSPKIVNFVIDQGLSNQRR